MAAFGDGVMLVSEFVHEVGWGDLPDVVRGQGRRCLLDVLGAYLWFDGREVSPPGAAVGFGTNRTKMGWSGAAE
jgi:hypothetical protein